MVEKKKYLPKANGTRVHVKASIRVRNVEREREIERNFYELRRVRVQICEHSYVPSV